MNRQFSEVQKEEILSRYYAGERLLALAKAYGCRSTAIHEVLVDRGADLNMHKYKGSPADREWVAKRYAEGESSRELAKEFGISETTVRKWARGNGVSINPRGNRYREFTDDDVAEMARLWNSGEPQEAIAQKYGTSQTVVSRVMRQRGYRSKGERKPRNGGRIVTEGGYVDILIPPDHPMASMRKRSGYVLEHRLVMAQSLGRPLHPGETVHHKDGVRSNNSIENLQLRQGRHGKGTIMKCVCCGSTDIVAVPIDSED